MKRKIGFCLVPEPEVIDRALSCHLELSEEDEVQIIHVFERKTLFNEIAPYSFPPEEQMPVIEETLKKIFDDAGEELRKKYGKNLKVQSFCLFSSGPKQKLLDFIKKENWDIGVVVTKASHGLPGLFHDHVAEFLLRHAPCELHMVRLIPLE